MNNNEMDDIVILCENKTIAQNNLEMISRYANVNLNLTFNSKTKIFKNIQGVNFCGYKINEYRLKIRNQSKYRMKRKLKLFTKQLKSGKIILSEIQKSIAGWTGYVKHADTFNLMKSIYIIYIYSCTIKRKICKIIDFWQFNFMDYL